VTAKLISEPPLLVLPSLAKELGVTDAIILQQLHYAAQRTPEGWVERSYPDWHRAIRGVFSARTIERAFAKLLEKGWVERAGEEGMVSRWRVAPDKLTGDHGPDGATGCRGSVSRDNGESTPSPKKSPKTILAEADEPNGFLEWLGHHVAIAGQLNLSMSVPRHGTRYRSSLARTFAALAGEGFTLEEFKLASEGVLSDDWMRLQGHVKPENVLRVEKIGGRVENGRLWRQKRATTTDTTEKYGHLDD
jgi:hypothetical protein